MRSSILIKDFASTTSFENTDEFPAMYRLKNNLSFNILTLKINTTLHISAKWANYNGKYFSSNMTNISMRLTKVISSAPLVAASGTRVLASRNRLQYVLNFISNALIILSNTCMADLIVY